MADRLVAISSVLSLTGHGRLLPDILNALTRPEPTIPAPEMRARKPPVVRLGKFSGLWCNWRQANQGD